MLLATISDDRGINLSSAGVGQQINVTVDETGYHGDVARFFTPDHDSGDHCSGSIAYPLENLAPGHHTITLRVWDTAGNMAHRSLECNVIPGLAPQIFDIYTDTNPASTEARFYISHNRPDARMTVKVTVYNLLGQPVWSSSATGRQRHVHILASDRDPDRREPDGAYSAAHTCTAPKYPPPAGEFSSVSRKLAVTSR